MAGRFNGSGLMNVHMTGVGRDHGFIRLQQGFDHQHIGLRAAYQKVNRCIRSITETADLFTCRLAARIQAITDSLFQIGLHQSLKHLGMRTFTIVIAETVHIISYFLKHGVFVMILLLQ